MKIDKKIVKYRVRKPEEKPVAEVAKLPVKETAKVIRMTEELQRPEMLIGSTYKIKTPVSDHAMYVTINDIILNGELVRRNGAFSTTLAGRVLRPERR